MALEVSVQRTASHVLHDKIDVRICFKCLINLSYVLMAHSLEKFDFSSHTPLTVNIVKLGFIVNLNRKLFSAFDMNSVLDHSISALAQFSPECELFHLLF